MAPFPKDSLSRFVFGAAGTALALVVLWAALSNPLTEAADRVYFAAALGVGALALRLPSASYAPALGAASVLGLVVMAWGLVTIEHQSLIDTLWLGFGWYVAAGVLLLLPLCGLLLRSSESIPRAYRVAAYAALACVAAVAAPSLVQTKASLARPGESAYIFNELYSVAASHYPYSDFVPQYQTLFAYLFKPLIVLLGPERALNPMLAVFSALSVAIVGLGVLAGLLATRGLNRILAPLLILPLVLLTQGPGRSGWSGSIGALHSAFPVRMLMPTVVGVLLACLPVLGAQRWDLRRHVLPLGLLLGLSCYHQLDFGVAATAALGTVIVVAELPSSLPRTIGCFAGAVALGFLGVPCLHWLADAPLDFGKVGWFVRQFGGGFGAEPMQIPGPLLVVLPLLIGSSATCLAALRAQRSALLAGGWSGAGALSRLLVRAGASEPALLPSYRAALIGSYFGVFAICAFPYYLNRSYASGQLQILLLPLGIALAASVQLIAASPEWREHGRSARSLVFRFALSTPVASLLLLPSPAHEFARLSGTHADTRWPSEKTAAIIALGDAWRKLGTSDTVGYWGNDGNYIEASTGLHNLTRFSSPLDGAMSPAAMKELCSGIAKESVRALILGEMAQNPTTCGGEWTFKKSKAGVVVALRGEPDQTNATAQSSPAR